MAMALRHGARLQLAQRRLALPSMRSVSSSADPVTKEVAKVEQRGKEGKEVAEVRPEGAAVAAGVVSGAPDELNVRPVRIFRPAPTTMQSARSTSHQWVVDWDVLQGGGRWEWPLMGWAASADYMQGTKVSFDTKDEAIAFCEKQGWPYYVQEAFRQRFKPKSYSGNFVYSPDALRLLKTK